MLDSWMTVGSMERAASKCKDCHAPSPRLAIAITRRDKQDIVNFGKPKAIVSKKSAVKFE
jgi:hypothetical protein